MMNRRDLIKGAAAAAMLGEVLAARASVSPPPRERFYKFIYDRRFAAAARSAKLVTGTGSRTSAIVGDVTGLWQEDLRIQWAEGPRPLAGMTTAGALTCIEQMGRDVWLRRALRVNHRALANGRVAHDLEGAAPLVSDLSRHLARGSADWPTQLAVWLLTADLSVSPAPSARQRVVTARFGTDAERPLSSWILAPRRFAMDKGITL